MPSLKTSVYGKIDEDISLLVIKVITFPALTPAAAATVEAKVEFANY